MGRNPSYSKEEGLNKGAWTAMEDKILTEYIKIHGEGKWRNLPKKAGLRRNGKSCRLRWLNYLRPGIKRGNITNDEEDLIIRLHNLLGNRWSLIAGRLPGRTDNEIKNYWNTIIGKKLQNQKLQLNQPQPPLQIKKSKSPPSLPNVNDDANVICNKVVVPSTHQPQQNTHDLQLFVDDINSAQSTSKFSLEDNNVNNDDSSDLLLDFEMDDQFLSNLLNADFSQLKNFDSGCDQLSLDSDKSLLASDDAIKDLGLPSVTSDFEFNWPHIERK